MWCGLSFQTASKCVWGHFLWKVNLIGYTDTDIPAGVYGTFEGIRQAN